MIIQQLELGRLFLGNLPPCDKFQKYPMGVECVHKRVFTGGAERGCAKSLSAADFKLLIFFR